MKKLVKSTDYADLRRFTQIKNGLKDLFTAKTQRTQRKDFE